MILKKYIFIVISKMFTMFKLKNYIIFESNPTYSDNTKILYKYMENKGFLEDKRVFWVRYNNEKTPRLKNVKYIDLNYKNFLSKLLGRIIFLYYCSQSKFYLFSHKNLSSIKPRKNQYFINLTHGISLKNTKGMYPPTELNSIILVLSDFTSKLREISFPEAKDKMRKTGFPRNDLLFLNMYIEKKDYFIINEFDKYENLLVWLPTFRRHKNKKRNDTNTSDSSDLPIINNSSDLKAINNTLKNSNSLLLIKPHPAQDLSYFRKVNLSNIKVITSKELRENDVHLYEILSLSDALITDYSSVYIDYLIIDKPIGFTIDDLEAYKNNIGFLVDNPLNYMPGAKIKNTKNLNDFISSVISKEDNFKEERSNLQELFHENVDNSSTARVYEMIKSFDKKEKI